MFRYTKKKDEKFYKDEINKIHTETTKKVHEKTEFEQNNMQIRTIRDVLIRNLDVPEELIDWLINSVEENKDLEHEAFNNAVCKYFISKI